MPFIELPKALSDVKEKVPAAEGKYHLRISDAQVGKSTRGKPQVRVVIAIDEHPECRSVLHYVSLPAEGDPADKVETKLLMMRRFLQMFHLSEEEINTDDWFGAEADGELALVDALDDDDNPTGEKFNNLKLDKLAEAPAEGTSGRRRRA